MAAGGAESRPDAEPVDGLPGGCQGTTGDALIKLSVDGGVAAPSADRYRPAPPRRDWVASLRSVEGGPPDRRRIPN